VADYVQRFTELVDQLSAYTSTTDPWYFTLGFIDGLRDDIKSIVHVQRPKDLDTACVLASLQEEVDDSSRRRDYKRSDPPPSLKPASRVPLPLPPPPRPVLPASAPVADHRGIEASRAGSSPEARAAALCTYRCAMGLCYQCGKKWSRDHTCSQMVQLHVVQELWELFQLEDGHTEQQSSPADNSEELFLAISKAVVMGVDAPRAVKLLGSIQDHSVTMLVDSGRSSSFISCQLAAQLSGSCPLPNVDTQNWHDEGFLDNLGRTGQTSPLNRSDRSRQVCQIAN
jgi:hypothetical protein